MTGDLRSFYDDLASRALADGSFSNVRGGSGCSDSTAWAVLALEAGGAGNNLLAPARRHLCSVRSEDGRIPVYPDHLEGSYGEP